MQPKAFSFHYPLSLDQYIIAKPSEGGCGNLTVSLPLCQINLYTLLALEFLGKAGDCLTSFTPLAVFYCDIYTTARSMRAVSQ